MRGCGFCSFQTVGGRSSLEAGTKIIKETLMLKAKL